MPSHNRTEGIGNLTRDPSLTYVSTGDAVCKFTVAINERYGEKEEVTYLDLIAWRKLGENAEKYLKKGSLVFFAGRLKIRKYDNKDGVAQKAVEVTLNELVYLDPKDKRRSRDSNGQNSSNSSQYSGGSSGSGYGGGHPSDDPADDDIPF